MFRKIFTMSLAVIAVLCLLTGGWAAPNNSGGNSNASGHNKVPNVRSGLIQMNRGVYYPGDIIEVRMVFPRSLRAVWSGEADSHIVVRWPDGTVFSQQINVDGWVPDQPANFVELEIPEDIGTNASDDEDLGLDDLPIGEYQLALVLTKKAEQSDENGEGDGTALSPLNLENWYEGFAGLVSVARFKFNTETDDEDNNGDGTIDGDSDGDGFEDDDDADEDDNDTQEEDDNTEQ
jgi:hypothetical protein